MTTSIRLLFRLAMFALAAATLALAFSGVALAAPGGQDTVSPTPHTNQPVYIPPSGWEPVPPESEPEGPSEPPEAPGPEPTEPPTTAPEPAPAQPTGAPTPEPAPRPAASLVTSTSTTPPGTDVPAASQPANGDAVRVAIGAGLAAVLLGGGWLATSLGRVIRQERHS